MKSNAEEILARETPRGLHSALTLLQFQLTQPCGLHFSTTQGRTLALPPCHLSTASAAATPATPSPTLTPTPSLPDGFATKCSVPHSQHHVPGVPLTPFAPAMAPPLCCAGLPGLSPEAPSEVSAPHPTPAPLHPLGTAASCAPSSAPALPCAATPSAIPRVLLCAHAQQPGGPFLDVTLPAAQPTRQEKPSDANQISSGTLDGTS